MNLSCRTVLGKIMVAINLDFFFRFHLVKQFEDFLFFDPPNSSNFFGKLVSPCTFGRQDKNRPDTNILRHNISQ